MAKSDKPEAQASAPENTSQPAAKSDKPEAQASEPVAAAAPPPTEEDVRRSEQAKAKDRARARAAAAKGKYKVTLGDLSGTYEARDANEAWAMFCDAHKTWPSPKYSQRSIVKVA